MGGTPATYSEFLGSDLTGYEYLDRCSISFSSFQIHYLAMILSFDSYHSVSAQKQKEN
jgi:hypothetical protein